MRLREEADRTVYASVDVAKFLCALFVVMIHVSPFGWQPPGSALNLLNFGMSQYLARLAVPMFFAFSGYFLYRKTLLQEFSLTPTKKYVWKLLKLYLIWSAIYLPLCVKGILSDKAGAFHGVLAYAHRFVMSGSYLQLWYLNAAIVAVLLISFLLYKRVSVKKILGSALFLYCIGVLELTWFGAIEPLQYIFPEVWGIQNFLMHVIVTTRDGLFDGFLFVSIGMFLAYYEVEFSANKARILFVISMLFLLLEAFFVHHHHLAKAYDMYFFLAPAVLFGFFCIMQIRLQDRPVYRTLRLLSMLIFYLHPWMIKIIQKILEHVLPSMAKTSMLFVLTVFGTILLSVLILHLSERPHFIWMKHLYR